MKHEKVYPTASTHKRKHGNARVCARRCAGIIWHGEATFAERGRKQVLGGCELVNENWIPLQRLVRCGFFGALAVFMVTVVIESVISARLMSLNHPVTLQSSHLGPVC